MGTFRVCMEDNDLEDDNQLLRLYREGQAPETQDRFIERFSGLVFAIARKFRGRAEWEDLVQVGYLGLMKAVDGYNPELSVRFSTYAYHCIFGEVTHFIRDRQEVIRRPRWLNNLSKQVGRYVETYSQTHHRLPKKEEVAAELGVTPGTIDEVMRIRVPISLDNPNPGWDVDKFKSSRYESFQLPLEDRIALEQAFETLVKVEQDLIYLFFYRDLTQGQISKVTGLSPKKVSRVIKKGLDRLRAILGLKDDDNNE